MKTTIKGSLIRGCWLLIALTLAGQAGQAAADDDARAIMEKNFYASKISTLKCDATMVLVSDNGQTRERQMGTVQKLQPNGMDSELVMKFSSPADIRGVSFLQIEHTDSADDQWIYLPGLKKTRRLVADNKKDSFLGSDFSYGDFSRPKVDWYHHKLLRTEDCDGGRCYVIESLPATDEVRNDLGYSRKINWVRTDSFVEAKVEYYDLSGSLLKTQLVSNVKLVEPARQRWFAMHREILNHQTGHKTVLDFANEAAGMAVADDVFTTRTIERE